MTRMKAPLVLVVFLLTVLAFAQQRDNARRKGVIYGVAIGQDGQPAKGLGLTAYPGLAVGETGFAVGGILPHTRTNQAGEYRFENLELRRYTVYANDEEAGYSVFSAGSNGDGSHSVDVELTVEHPEAEFRVYLPPRAGFLEIYLTDRKNGAGISAMRIEVTRADAGRSLVFRMSGYSNHVILIPPEQDLLLHVSSDGFGEWEESVGTGKPIHLASGTRLTLDVQLEPLKE
jgi:hypothetical protein